MIMNRILLAVLLVVATLPFDSVFATQWNLAKEKDGIKIFTAKLPDQAFKAVRVECLIAARPEQLLALLLDINNNHEWVYKTKSSRRLKTISPTELIYYAQMESPWPFSNRDIIAHLKVSRQSDKIIIIDSKAKPDYIPDEEDVVRIQSSKAQWTLTSIQDNMVKVEYVIQFDPGGNIPPWLINLFVSDGPMVSFQKMKERVNLPEYKNTRLEI